MGWEPESVVMIDAVGRALERVLGDRQWHEAQITAAPASNADGYRSQECSPSLRIYVACKRGRHALIDDRSSLTAAEQQRIEVVEAEFAATSPEALAGLPAGANPRISCGSECKGEMLHRLDADNQRRAAMDYVAFLDDDIAVSISDLVRGTEAAARRSCMIFQLQLSQDSHAVWPLLKERREAEDPPGTGFPELWSDLDFVEIMAPVIAQSELDRGLLRLLAPFKSGFGWDFYLLPVLKLLYSDFRPGLYRGASMRHERPVQTSNTTRFSHGLTAVQEEELIRAGLLMRLLDGSAQLERSAWLGRLHDTWTEGSEQLRCVASALNSISERHWLARSLEHQVRAQQQRLKAQDEQLALHNSDLEARQADIERLIVVHRDEQIAMRAQVAHVDGRNCELHETLQRSQAELQRSQAELQRCHAEINGYASFVRDLKRSATWRLGRLLLKPFSVLKSLVKRRPTPKSVDG